MATEIESTDHKRAPEAQALLDIFTSPKPGDIREWEPKFVKFSNRDRFKKLESATAKYYEALQQDAVAEKDALTLVTFPVFMAHTLAGTIDGGSFPAYIDGTLSRAGVTDDKERKAITQIILVDSHATACRIFASKEISKHEQPEVAYEDTIKTHRELQTHAVRLTYNETLRILMEKLSTRVNTVIDKYTTQDAGNALLSYLARESLMDTPDFVEKMTDLLGGGANAIKKLGNLSFPSVSLPRLRLPEGLLGGNSEVGEAQASNAVPKAHFRRPITHSVDYRTINPNGSKAPKSSEE